jgi:hypothetical protein
MVEIVMTAEAECSFGLPFKTNDDPTSKTEAGSSKV